MTSGNSEKRPAVEEARRWLESAAEDHARLSGALDRGYVAAMIGDGYARLAQVEAGLSWPPRRVSEIPPALAAAVDRVARAAEEARPHDDEAGHVWMPDPDEPGRRCVCAIGRDHDEDPTETEASRG